jgi:ADP-ribose pyrophosphatase YjhB (NUDIX family)
MNECERRAAKPRHVQLPVAVHLFLIQDGAVLLLRRANTGYEDGNYSVIAGHIDGGEPLTSAMIREAREEAGIEIAPDDIAVVGVMHQHDPYEEYIDFFLTARSWQGEICNREPHKCSELAWYPLDRLPPNVIPYVRQALENYHHGVWFDSFGW